MNKLKIMLAIVVVFLVLATLYTSLQALPTGALPQPEFEKKNFLLTSDIEEMNVDFAVASGRLT